VSHGTLLLGHMPPCGWLIRSSQQPSQHARHYRRATCRTLILPRQHPYNQVTLPRHHPYYHLSSILPHFGLSLGHVSIHTTMCRVRTVPRVNLLIGPHKPLKMSKKSDMCHLLMLPRVPTDIIMTSC
jgi:hypothetical protein